ncbi:MAG: hypothetical protein JWM75_335, partial [Sphingomonas bacterium]|nr:hypothetical protein [Sphingomonas bacterium]
MSARVATITKLGFAGLGVTLASAAFGL